jgi:putative ABC transport system permease protein
VPADAIALGAAFMVGLGLVAGAVPATQAMRLRIVEALRRD